MATQTYKNLSRTSGVHSFELQSDSIKVRFKDCARVYEYSYQSAGGEYVEAMKKLAVAGHGLNTFINQYTKSLFIR
jgi:hypothetical protein